MCDDMCDGLSDQGILYVWVLSNYIQDCKSWEKLSEAAIIRTKKVNPPVKD